MIVEDEREGEFDYSYETNGESESNEAEVTHGPLTSFAMYCERSAAMHDKRKHYGLQVDLIEHIWHRFGHDEV